MTVTLVLGAVAAAAGVFAALRARHNNNAKSAPIRLRIR